MAEAYQKKELLALMNTGANKCTFISLLLRGTSACLFGICGILMGMGMGNDHQYRRLLGQVLTEQCASIVMRPLPNGLV